MKIKVCGLTREEDVRFACKLGAWAVGFVFAESPRRVSVEQAVMLRKAVAPGVLSVGVFVDAVPQFIASTIKTCRLDAVQLYGTETSAQREKLGVPVFKALFCSDRLSLDAYADCDKILLEPKRSLEDRRVGRAPGDAERMSCWAFARGTGGGKVILAGGLTAENVARAAEMAAPFAVDVSGGVEETPGKKSRAKLAAFFLAAG